MSWEYSKCRVLQGRVLSGALRNSGTAEILDLGIPHSRAAPARHTWDRALGSHIFPTPAPPRAPLPRPGPAPGSAAARPLWRGRATGPAPRPLPRRWPGAPPAALALEAPAIPAPLRGERRERRGPAAGTTPAPARSRPARSRLELRPRPRHRARRRGSRPRTEAAAAARSRA